MLKDRQNYCIFVLKLLYYNLLLLDSNLIKRSVERSSEVSPSRLSVRFYGRYLTFLNELAVKCHSDKNLIFEFFP